MRQPSARFREQQLFQEFARQLIRLPAPGEGPLDYLPPEARWQEHVFEAVRDFQPEVVLYAWPPPGQSLARICQAPFLRYLMVVGEAGGDATGAPEDWRLLPHRYAALLSRYGRGRTGWGRHRVTVFYGAGALRFPPRNR